MSQSPLYGFIRSLCFEIFFRDETMQPLSSILCALEFFFLCLVWCDESEAWDLCGWVCLYSKNKCIKYKFIYIFEEFCSKIRIVWREWLAAFWLLANRSLSLFMNIKDWPPKYNYICNSAINSLALFTCQPSNNIQCVTICFLEPNPSFFHSTTCLHYVWVCSINANKFHHSCLLSFTFNSLTNLSTHRID